MKGCRRESVLVSDSGLCINNIQRVTENAFDNHVGLIFFAALVLIGICSYVASRSPIARPLRDDNINYQLGRINDRLDGMGK